MPLVLKGLLLTPNKVLTAATLEKAGKIAVDTTGFTRIQLPTTPNADQKPFANLSHPQCYTGNWAV